MQVQVGPPDRRQFNLDAVLVSQEDMEERMEEVTGMRKKMEDMLEAAEKPTIQLQTVDAKETKAAEATSQLATLAEARRRARGERRSASAQARQKQAASVSWCPRPKNPQSGLTL